MKHLLIWRYLWLIFISTQSSIIACQHLNPDLTLPKAEVPSEFQQMQGHTLDSLKSDGQTNGQANGQSNGQVQATEPKINVFDLGFWQKFGDPELIKLLEMGLEQNQDLAIAYAKILQALAFSGQKESSLYPTIDGNLRTPIQRVSLEDPSIRAFSRFPQFERVQNSYRPEAVFSWEIDFFGTKRFAREQAQNRLMSAKANLVATQLTMISQITQNYLSIRSIQQRIKLFEKIQADNQELLKLYQIKKDAGLSNDTQILQISSQINQNQTQILKLKGMLSNYLKNLASLTASAPQNLIKILQNDQPQFPRFYLPIDQVPIPSDLLKRRPDLISAEYQLKASAWAVSSAVAEKYPKFNLSASAALLSKELSTLFTSDALFSNLIPGMSWRLLDFGYLDALVDQKKAEQKEAVAVYRKTIVDAFAEAESSLMILVLKQHEQTQMKEGENIQDQLLSLKKVQYDEGLIDFSGVIEQQKLLTQAKEQVLISQEEYLIAVMNVFKALGGGWQGDLKEKK
jgi:NodT family efflux transporter outer membrane factor (OMF) lipoprotein